jgi:predicted nucleic acid-binding protein
MKVVVNTTPIISLATINHLHLFEKLFGKIIIAEAVYQEIKAKQSYAYYQVDSPFIEVQKIQGFLYKELLLAQLDSGEAETIILAKEIEADFVIIDENIGYKLANNAGLTTIRTLSILLKAKEKNIISEIKPLLDEMIIKGRWYSKSVYQNFLTHAGEL